MGDFLLLGQEHKTKGSVFGLAAGLLCYLGQSTRRLWALDSNSYYKYILGTQSTLDVIR